VADSDTRKLPAAAAANRRSHQRERHTPIQFEPDYRGRSHNFNSDKFGVAWHRPSWIQAT